MRDSLTAFCRAGAERTAWLRERLERPEILVMPCAYDGLTAGLVQKADFETTFVRAAHANVPGRLPFIWQSSVTASSCVGMSR